MRPSHAAVSPTDWFGQPRGLTILFMTEMWDQFSFYGMRALLVLYMTKQLMIPQSNASWIYGIYAATVYFTPLFGGMITDRWLSRRTSVVVGGGIMAAGHFMMAYEHLLLPALATIALGNGLFLPSLPSQIDSLYAPKDPRRKSAYNIYYVGINIGALLAPIVIGTVGETFGFHWGFGIAGAGMIIALTTYLLGRGYLPPEPVRDRPATRAVVSRDQDMKGDLARRAVLLLSIMAAVMVFRGAYEQLGNTLALWIDQGVDRRLSSSFSIPVTWFQSLNPLMVFTLTPIFVARWTRMAARQREPSSLTKMVIGAAVVAGSYLLLAAVATWSRNHAGLVAWPWMAAVIVMMTAGELYILPVGLGLFGRLAPVGLTATAIATWFFAGFIGNLFAGWLGTLWGPLDHGEFFLIIGGVALAAAGLLALLNPKVSALEKAR